MTAYSSSFVGSEILVNSQTASYQTNPTITGLSNGGFVVTWTDSSGTLGDADGSSIKAQVFDAVGAQVGSEFLVNTETASYQYSPTISGLSNGGFVVTWSDSSGTLGDADGSSIKAQVFDAVGAQVGSEFLVNTETAHYQYNPSVTSLSNGGFVVTWFDFSSTLGDTAGTRIKAQVFDAGGAQVGNEVLVNTETASYQYNATITGLSDGGFVVTWIDLGGTLGDTDGTSIKAQFFNAGGAKIGSEFIVNTQTAGDQSNPAITGLSNGGFVVTWHDTSGTLGDSDGMSIKAQVFHSDGAKVGSEFLVNTETAGDQFNPTVSSLSNGGFVVTWSDSSGTLGDTDGLSIKAQVFDAAGEKVGSEFLVNADISGDQYNPVIAGLNNGGFAVSWFDASGTLDDSASLNVHAQVFALDHAAVSMAENQTAVATVTADYPLGNANLTYAIAGGSDAGAFEIDASTGVLSFKAAPDFEHPADSGADNVYDVGVQVSDGAMTHTYTFAVTVTNINEAPVITSNGGETNAGASIAENQTAVTTFTGHDPDVGAVLTYSIVGGDDGGLFQIDTSTGALSFKVGPDFEHPLDTNADNVYDVVVQVSDGNQFDSKALAVTVTNADEAVEGSVVLSIAQTASVSGIQSAIITAQSTLVDPDVAGALTLVHDWQTSVDGGAHWIDVQVGVDATL